MNQRFKMGNENKINSVCDLHEYQKYGVDYILSRKKCALQLGMGTGKTIITLTALKNLMENGIVQKILVIAPLSVAESVWHTELSGWDYLQDVKYQICTGYAEQREKALSQNSHLYIINRENVPWLMQKGYMKQFDALVIDESTSFKNPQSKRFKSIRYHDYEYVITLTGTPSPNGLLDLWAPTYLLDRGKSLGNTFTKYKQKYFYSDFWGYNWTPKDPKQIFKAISHITLSMQAIEHLQMPDKIEVSTLVKLPNIKQYNQFKKDCILQIGETQITAINAAVVTNKLLQYANGSIYDADKKHHEVHSEKLNALQDIVEDNSGENILVAYNFRHDLERLKKKFGFAEVLNPDNKQIIDKWNAGKIRMLLCNPASSGMGLNLQYGGRIIVWFSLTWNLEHYLQFNARIFRQGQTKSVTINHIIASNTIDEYVFKKLQQKENVQSQLLDYVKWIKDGL